MMLRILLNYERRDNDREIDEIELIGVRHSFPIILLRRSDDPIRARGLRLPNCLVIYKSIL